MRTSPPHSRTPETTKTIRETGGASPETRGWLDGWESELLLFPNGRYDDQVDTLAYVALEVTKSRRVRVDLSGWDIDVLAGLCPSRPA